jgi:hypothetical protein
VNRSAASVPMPALAALAERMRMQVPLEPVE